MKYRQDIQILRGIAVLLVLLFHLQIPFFQNGFLGVDIFFVISGYLMAMFYDKGSFLDFYRRRFNRLFLPYAAVIILSLIVGCFLLLPSEFNQLFAQSTASTVFSPNLYFWNLNSYFSKSEYSPLLNLWSLGVEIQFYLIVPLLYPLLRKYPILLVLACVGSFIVCLLMQTISPKTSFFMMPLRVWEFLLGASIAWFSLSGVLKVSNYKLLQSILLLFLVLAVVFLPVNPESKSFIYGHPSIIALIVCLLTSAIIAFGHPEDVRGDIVSAGLEKLGQYSYSIYLVHFPIIVFWNYQEFGGTDLIIESYHGYFIVIALIAVLSFVFYHLFEQKKYNSAQLQITALFMLIFVLFSSGAINKGKYSEIEQNIFAAYTDRSEYRCGKLFRVTNPFQTICQVNEVSSDRRVLLLGNSHADAIKTPLSDFLQKKDVSLFFYVENDPLLNGGANVKDVLDGIERMNIKSVIFHYSNVYSDEAVIERFEKLIDNLNAKSVSANFISPVPAYSYVVPSYLYEKLNNQDVSKIEITQKDHFKKTEEFLKFSKSLTQKNTNIYDPSDFLCVDAKECLLKDKSHKPLYFDAHHLTLTGANYLVPMFENIFFSLSEK